MTDIKKIQCPECGSGAFYTLLDGTRRCKKCGCRFKDKEVK